MLYTALGKLFHVFFSSFSLTGSCLFQTGKQGCSDRLLRHGQPEIVQDRCADHRKGVLLRQHSISLHGSGIRKERHFLPGVVGACVSRVIPVVRRNDQKIVFS